MDSFSQQIQQFIRLRDEALDHELFGAFEGFRDLQYAPPIEQEQLSVFQAKFRAFLPFSPDSLAPLVCMSRPEVCEARYLIFPDRIESEQRETQNEDAVLAEPAIFSNQEFGALASGEDGEYYTNLLATWIVRRAPISNQHALNAFTLERRVSAIINEATRQNHPLRDNEIIERIYEFLYSKPYPQHSERYSLPNSKKRVNERIRELDELFAEQSIRPQLRSVLDVGCAEGAFAFYLKERYNLQRAAGMDIREPLPEYNLEFVEASALQFQPEFEDEFDLVCISMTLHHISNYKTVLRNAGKYVKRGGFLFIREHDASLNTHKLLLDLHDECFNGCLWETPESSIMAFEAHARSWFLSENEVRACIGQFPGFKEVAFSKIRGQMRDWELYGRVWYGLWSKL